MEINSNSTFEELKEALKQTTNVNKLRLIINHQNSNEVLLYEAYQTALSLGYIDQIEWYTELIKSPKAKPEILCKIVEKTKSKTIILKAIESPKADNTVLEKVVEKNYSSDQNLENECYIAVIESDKVTPEILCTIIEKTKSKAIILRVIESPKTDNTVLEEVVEKNYSSDQNLENECYTAVIESDKVTPEILYKIIEYNVSRNVILRAIRNPKADSRVLEKVVKESYSYDLSLQIECYTAVIESDKVTPEILCKIIENINLEDIIVGAIRSPKADSRVLEKVVEECCSYAKTTQIECYKEVIQSDKVTPEILCKIIEKTKLKTIILRVIESPKADSRVLEKVVEEGCLYEPTVQMECYTAVMESDKVTPKILCRIIANAESLFIIVAAIKSSKIDESVLQFAENKASFEDDSSRRNKILLEIKKRRQALKIHPEIRLIKTVDTLIQGENNMNFTIEQEDNVTERIRRNVEDGMSTMLWGLSGIGKTARVREVDPTFTMIKLKNDMLPEEITGGKEPNGAPGEMYPPKWYVKLCEKCEKEPDKMHILFIDELTNVKNNVKSLVWDIIEDRRVNGDEDWQLPDNCAIVAAGNRPDESTAVITDYNGGVLPEPLHDRFDFHIEIPLDMVEWQQWALEKNPKTGNLNIHPAVFSFCVSRSDDVMFTSLNEEDITQPRLSPRRWEKLSRAIYMAEKRGGKNCHVSNQRIAECIGEDIAQAFIAHYEKTPLDMKKVEQGLYEPSEFESIDDKLFAISSLIAEYKGSELAVLDFIENCLGDDYIAIYNIMRKQSASISNSFDAGSKSSFKTY